MSEPHPTPHPAPAALPSALNRALLQRLLWREWQHHPWRHLVALFAVALGVALAWSVHLINTSALAEFSTAVRSANGEPDLTLRSDQGRFDDALLDRVANDPAVLAASPVLELDTYARRPPAATPATTAAASAASTPDSPSASTPTRL
ncbi:MAG: ABC transporter permease, partial [Rubrivivax sp.]